MNDELRTQKHYYEQQAYTELRILLQERFIEDPKEFMSVYGARPEDIPGPELRSIYPHLTGMPLMSKNQGFIKRFRSGAIFVC